MNAVIDTDAPSPSRVPPHPTHKFKLLLRREFWEHKGGFFWAPIWAGAISLVLTLMALVVGEVAMRRAIGAGENMQVNGVDVSVNGLDLGALASRMDAGAARDFAGGVDPSENLVWFRPEQIGVYNWSGFDSPEFETSYQKLVAETDEAKRVALSNRMEDLMEESGDFIFICHQPLVAIHRNGMKPVIYPDGHPNPVLFKKA